MTNTMLPAFIAVWDISINDLFNFELAKEYYQKAVQENTDGKDTTAQPVICSTY